MSYIGMDISSNRIAVAEVAKNRNKFLVTNAAVFEVPQQVIEKGEIKDTKVVSNAIKEIWNYYRFRSNKVLVGLSNPKVIIKEIKLPLTDDKEIDSAIRYQINDLVPIAKDNITYDYFIVDKHNGSSDVMIAGAAKNIIDSIVESLRAIKINPAAIDLNCFSLYRTMDAAYDFQQAKTKKGAYCLVSIGKNISIINMVTEGQLKFPRFSNIGIEKFIDYIVKKLNLGYSEAEKILDTFDFDLSLDIQFDRKLASGELPNAGTQVKKNNHDIALNVAIKEASSQFINEINRSIDYFLNRYAAYHIEKIILSGDTFLNFDRFAEKETTFPVEQFKISQFYDLSTLNKKTCYTGKSLEILGNQLTMAIGMALRGYGL